MPIGGRRGWAHPCYIHIWVYVRPVARASTTTDVFNAIGDSHRRAILDVLLSGEKSVSAIVGHVSMPQPHVSRHLRVLSEVGLVESRADGRRRLYRLAPDQLQPLHAWVAKYERAINGRLDRIEDYLTQLQRQGDDNDT